MNRAAFLLSRSSPVLRWLLFFAIIFFAVFAGIELRKWFYTASEDYRFPYDIGNAWGQGSRVCFDATLNQHDGLPLRWRSFWSAYLRRYDQVISDSPDGHYSLDYPPARLLIMSLWVKQYRSGVIPFFTDPAGEKLAAPLLWIDTTAEMLGAILAFFIVRQVLTRQSHPWTIWLALLSALLLWFDPTVFVDRVWPQWDSWVLPFFLAAALCALNRLWLLTGICLGVGMLFKGQILCTGAMFVLWPLFQGRWREAVDVIVGALLGLTICVSPWLIRTPLAAVMIVILLIAAGLALRFIPRGWRIPYVGASIVLAAFLSGKIFHGSFGWWWVPFAYSSHHFMELAVGTPNNLAAILEKRWQFQLRDPVFSVGKLHLTMRVLLVCIYSASLIACSFGLARHDLRNDRRVLIALATPWLLMFTFMPQMHERYLYWGAALTALAAGVSLGTMLLHILITLLSCVAMGSWIALGHSPGFTRLLHGMYPDSAWAVILITLIFLYLSLIPSPSSAKMS
jgi:hypothetical protein